MAGSVFFIGIVVVLLLAAGIALTPLFLIPAVVVAVVALVAGPALGWINRDRRTGGGGSTGVPTTEEASYEPVQKER